MRRLRGGREEVFLSVTQCGHEYGFCLHIFIVLCDQNVQVTGTMEPTISMNSNSILGFSHIEMLELITFLIVS